MRSCIRTLTPPSRPPLVAQLHERFPAPWSNLLRPLLRPPQIGIDPFIIFKDADWALLIGAKPRGPGMERADLLDINGKIFVEQGKALDQVGPAQHGVNGLRERRGVPLPGRLRAAQESDRGASETPAGSEEDGAGAGGRQPVQHQRAHLHGERPVHPAQKLPRPHAPGREPRQGPAGHEGPAPLQLG